MTGQYRNQECCGREHSEGIWGLIWCYVLCLWDDGCMDAKPAQAESDTGTNTWICESGEVILPSDMFL